MTRRFRPAVFVALTVLVIVATIIVGGVLAGEREIGATPRRGEQPSAVVSNLASPPSSRHPAQSPVPGGIFTGQLFALPDVACPGLYVDGRSYFLQLPAGYSWQPDGMLDADGSVVAHRGDTIRITGVEEGPETCWATTISRSIVVTSVTPIGRSETQGTTFVGRLTRYCDLGACCPALDVSGTRYALQLAHAHDWRSAGTRYEIRDRQGLVIAREDEIIFVEGGETGGDTCWATILERSIGVDAIATDH